MSLTSGFQSNNTFTVVRQTVRRITSANPNGLCFNLIRRHMQPTARLSSDSIFNSISILVFQFFKDLKKKHLQRGFREARRFQLQPFTVYHFRLTFKRCGFFT